MPNTGTGSLWYTVPSSTATSYRVTEPWATWAGTSSAVITSNVWYEWQARTTTMPIPAAPPTEWELEARRRSEERYRERQEAEARATELLREHLDDGQRATHEADRVVRVRGNRGGIYEICPGRAGNVYGIMDGRRARKYCIHPAEAVPEADVHLAQKLMIETDEDMFASIANVSRM